MTWRHLPGVLEFTMVLVEHGRPVRLLKWSGGRWLTRPAEGEYREALPDEVPAEVLSAHDERLAA
jgi:hypothetical protein